MVRGGEQGGRARCGECCQGWLSFRVFPFSCKHDIVCEAFTVSFLAFAVGSLYFHIMQVVNIQTFD